DLSVAGANGIVFAFALWGSAQLIYALIQLVVAFRYGSLVPFLYLLLILETLLRVLVGHMKPVTFQHTPPGAIGNYVTLPLAALMLVWSLWTYRADAPRARLRSRRCARTGPASLRNRCGLWRPEVLFPIAALWGQSSERPVSAIDVSKLRRHLQAEM